MRENHRVVLLLLTLAGCTSCAQLLHSVNCGGERHVDSVGIVFEEDTNRDGIASNYGIKHPFLDAPPADRALYQTERYGMSSFSYTFPLPIFDSDYAILFKFSEVYFERSGQKIFDVWLNGHTVIRSLDVFRDAGGIGRVLEKIVAFKISGQHLIVNDIVVDFDGEVEITFAKGSMDNPKCNAFALFRGSADEIPRAEVVQPQAPPQPQYIEELSEFERDDDSLEEDGKSNKAASGPPAPNPYESQDPHEALYPIAIAVILVIPIVIFLLRMN